MTSQETSNTFFSTHLFTYDTTFELIIFSSIDLEIFDEASKNEKTTLPLPVSEGAAVETKSTENTQPLAAAKA